MHGDGGRRAAPGTEARRPPHPGRPSRGALLPVRRHRHGDGQAARRRALDRGGQGHCAGATPRDRPAAGQRGGDRRAPAKKKALAIFWSDAISSSRLRHRGDPPRPDPRRRGRAVVSIQVAVAIAILLAVVSISYRQVCRAYPSGGGAYVVARENLAPIFGADRGRGAAHRLRDDGRGVDVVRPRPDLLDRAAVSAIRASRSALLSIVLIMVGNLRGLRESGNIFAVPTYVFVVLALTIVAAGVLPHPDGEAHARPAPAERPAVRTAQASAIFLILRAFASGSVALTGVEAIANGVPAFKPPEAKNAAEHDDRDGRAAGILFVGITIVAHAYDGSSRRSAAPRRSSRSWPGPRSATGRSSTSSRSRRR